MKKVNDFDLMEMCNIISNPFSREIQISKIKKEFGDGFFVFYDMGNGIAVFIRNFVPNKDFILIENSNISGASFIFNLASNIQFRYQDEREFILKKHHFFLELASDKFNCEIPIKKNEPFISFLICIKEELFLKLAHPINNINENMKEAWKNNYSILNDLEIDTLQSELFSDFKKQQYFEDILTNIYLESKTTSLLHYSIEKITNDINNKKSQNYNKEKLLSLEKAKELIMTEYGSKLSIKNIAYKSAINECYLKKNFKEYYGMTILEMLQKRRLEVAKQLLQENYGVKEVSMKVGYKNSNHFSKLFFEFFSLTPSNYRKQFNHC